MRPPNIKRGTLHVGFQLRATASRKLRRRISVKMMHESSGVDRTSTIATAPTCE